MKKDIQGYADADGSHYCPHDDNCVKTDQGQCKARAPEKVKARQARIIRAGALDDCIKSLFVVVILDNV